VDLLALHAIRAAPPPAAARARPSPPPKVHVPLDAARFARGMAAKGSSPEGIAWFLGGDS
jgi:hypothetical protein